MSLFSRPTARPAQKRAFTLLELIVVIVVLGVLAAIAIPTFKAVIDRSSDAATNTTVKAMLRDAQALVAFQDGTTWDEAMEIAAAETASALSPGLSAAGGYTPLESLTAEPSSTEAVYYEDSTVLVLALRSESGRICVGSATLTSQVAPECVPPYAPTDAVKSTIAAVASGELLSLPVGATPLQLDTIPPAVPAGLTLVAGNGSVATSWTAVADATSYRVYVDGAPVATSSTTSYTLSSLQNGTTYSISVSALDKSGNESALSAASSATPAAPPLTGSSALSAVSSGSAVGQPFAVAQGPDGSLYNAAHYQSRVYRTTSAGTTAPYAGNGGGGNGSQTATEGQVALEAAIGSNMGATVGPDGLTYYSDYYGGKVWRVLADGTLDAVSGGLGASSTYQMAFGPDGFLYVAAGANVYKVDAATGAKTVAASGFNIAVDVAVASNGDLFVADFNANQVIRVTPAGAKTVIAGTGTYGFSETTSATSSMLAGPAGIALASDGSLYIADSGNHRIRKVTPTGTISTVVGTGVAGSTLGSTGATTQVNGPRDAYIAPSGTLYVADTSNYRLLSLHP